MANSGTAFLPNEAHAVTGVCLMLSRLWAKEVDRELLLRLNAEPELNRLLPLPKANDRGDDASWLEELAIDFCAIMIGPGPHAAPVQSVWSNGSISGRSSDLMREYLKCFDQVQIQVPELTDHFANQLQVAGLLLSGVGERAGESEFSLEMLTAFWIDHVNWARPMVRKARSIANTEFYRGVTDLTEELLDEGIRFFDIR